jgi:cytochrome bd-type quinol oxidase subunit 2
MTQSIAADLGGVVAIPIVLAYMMFSYRMFRSAMKPGARHL